MAALLVPVVVGGGAAGGGYAWATAAILDCDKAEDFLAGLRGD